VNSTSSPRRPATRAASSHRPEIDGLRAIAVGAVVVHHLHESTLPGGYLGVDVFFGISGFVVMSSVLRARAANASAFLSNFYVRRVKRIAPALIFCALFTTLFGFMLVPNIGKSIKTGIFSLVGAGNLYLYATEAEYGGLTGNYNLFTQTWSLGVEEQFYLVLPALYVVTVMLRGARSGRHQLLFVTLGLASIASLAAYTLTLASDPSAAFYLPWFRCWELFLGCMLAVLAWKRAKANPTPSEGGPLRPLLASSALASVLATFVWPEELGLLGAPTVTALLGTLAFIATTSERQPFHRLLVTPPFQLIGKVSYSFYLWHWPAVVLTRWTVGLTPVTMILAGLGALFMSVVSYYVVERPLRYSEWSSSRSRSLLYGGAATAATIFAVASAGLFDNQISRLLYLGDQRFVVGSEANDPRLLYSGCRGRGAIAPEKNCKVDLNSDGSGREALPDGAESHLARIFFVGDSHAAQLIYPLARLAGVEGRAIAHLRFGPAESSLAIFERQLSELVGPDDLVVVALASDRLYTHETVGYSYRPDARAIPELVDRLREMVAIASEVAGAKGAPLVLAEPAPKICTLEDYARAGLVAGSCSNDRESALAYGAPMREVFQQAAARSPNVESLDFYSNLCRTPRCGVIDAEGHLVFADDSPHITRWVQEQIIARGVAPVARLALD